jgi:hypothetical protein
LDGSASSRWQPRPSVSVRTHRSICPSPAEGDRSSWLPTGTGPYRPSGNVSVCTRLRLSEKLQFMNKKIKVTQ